MKLPWRLFGGDKRDDNAKNFAAEKIVKYRAICTALDVCPRNSSAAVPAVQSDPKTKRGNSHQRRRQGRRERRQGQKSSPPRKIVIYRTIRMGLDPDASNARIAVPAVQSDRKSKRGAPNQRQRKGGDKTKIVATEKIVNFFTIHTLLGIGTGNSSAVVSVEPPDRSSKRGALLGLKRHPKCQDRTSIGVFFFILGLELGQCVLVLSSNPTNEFWSLVMFQEFGSVFSKISGTLQCSKKIQESTATYLPLCAVGSAAHSTRAREGGSKRNVQS